MSSENLNFPLDASKYELQYVIGHGATSDVYVAKCLENNKTLSIKLINLEAYPLEIEFLRQEVAFWSSTQLPQVVRYYGSFVSGPMLYILMEYMAGGSVSDIIRFSYQKGFKDEKIIATILYAILKALSYIHSHDELHRDVKPGNALIGEDGQVKIADFGVAATLNENGQRKTARYTVIGTPCYMAPEILKEGTGYTQKADIWSFGITAIELATGQAPYSNLQPLAVVQKILRAPPPILTTRSGEHSSELCQVIKACLNHDPTKRPTADELLQMPFFALAQPPQYLKEVLISKIPTLEKRYEMIKAKGTQYVIDQNKQNNAQNQGFQFDFGEEATNSNPITQQQQQQQLLQIRVDPVNDNEKEGKEGGTDINSSEENNPSNNNFPLNNFGLNVIDFTTDNNGNAKNKSSANNSNVSSNIIINNSFSSSNANTNISDNSNVNSNSILNNNSSINPNQPETPQSPLNLNANPNSNEERIKKGRFQVTKKSSRQLSSLAEENIKLQSNSSTNSNISTGSVVHSSEILIPPFECDNKQQTKPKSNNYHSSFMQSSSSLPQSGSSCNLINKPIVSNPNDSKLIHNNIGRNYNGPQKFRIDTGNNISSPTKIKPKQLNNTENSVNLPTKNNPKLTNNNNNNNEEINDENLFQIVQKLTSKADKISEDQRTLRNEVQELHRIVQSLVKPKGT